MIFQAMEANGQASQQDAGLTGLRLELRRLQTTARLLHTTAHPDDEDGGMLVAEARGRGVESELLTLTRGEGGQNRLGSHLFDELGALRTLELLASDGYYGVSQRFTRAVDFGYSKTSEESLDTWGRQAILADMVREIRRFRPDVIVSRFSGTPNDGHGHHQAAAILTREAFHAAADPKAFPEQLAEGLAPWQASKLYIGNMRSAQDYTIALDTSTVDPLLGTSYQQFAMQGLRHQLSQGAGEWHPRTGLHYYKLIETAAGTPSARSLTSGEIQEKDFFEGLDTSLLALATRLGAEETKLPELRRQLTAIAGLIAKASAAAGTATAVPAPAVLLPLLEAHQLLRSTLATAETSSVSSSAKQDLVVNLRGKQEQLRHAIELASGIEIRALLDHPVRQGELAGTVVPGSQATVDVSVRLPMSAKIAIEPLLPEGWSYRRLAAVPAAHSASGSGSGAHAAAKFSIAIPRDAAYTRPYYHRDSPQQAVYTIDRPEFNGLPLTPWPMRVRVRCVFEHPNPNEPEFVGDPAPQGEVEFTRVVEADSGNKTRAGNALPARHPVAVVPPFSLTIEPITQIVPASRREPISLTVTVRRQSLPGEATAVSASLKGTLQLDAPPEWKVDLPANQVSVRPGDRALNYSFHLQPAGSPTCTGALGCTANVAPGRYRLRAALADSGKTYDESVSAIGREDLGVTYYFQRAQEELTLLDVAVPAMRIGYIMGAGDEIPAVLGQLGMAVHELSPEELAAGDLSRYDTIIAGVRAYDVRDDLRRSNQRLLDYVRQGGTLLVQHNTAIGVFNQGRFSPYPVELAHDRVSDEHSPVKLLAPEDEVFRLPNRITAADFDGWIQERGLYFLHSWDSHCRPLLEMNDRGEAPLAGGLVLCPYGSGTYIYSGLSFFRQLPSGVPGAIRLFVNLVAARGSQRSATGIQPPPTSLPTTTSHARGQQ